MSNCTCPNCGTTFKNTVSRKAKGFVYADSIADENGMFITYRRNGSIGRTSFAMTAKEQKTDDARRDKMKLKYATEARNKALIEGWEAAKQAQYLSFDDAQAEADQQNEYFNMLRGARVEFEPVKSGYTPPAAFIPLLHTTSHAAY